MPLSLEKLKELASAAGLDAAGVVDAQPPAGLREKLQQRLDEGRVTPFEEKAISRRLDAGLILPGCRSIVVVASSYSVSTNDQRALTGAGARGKVALCAQGPDYHLLLESRARLLVELLKHELAGPFSCRILIDRNPLVERELAAAAGLGWAGENCTLVNQSLGSFIALGTILLDRPLASSQPVESGCLNCGLCRAACPSGALLAPYILDPRRCLSYITQSPGIVAAPLRPLLGNMLYGCDLCQEACPHNQKTTLFRLKESRFILFRDPLLSQFLETSRQEFKRSAGLTAAGWRGRTTLQRNAVIALGNAGDSDTIPLLAGLLKNDPRPVIRLHAAWSLGWIGGPQACRCLEEGLKSESDPAVKKEIVAALES